MKRSIPFSNGLNPMALFDSLYGNAAIKGYLKKMASQGKVGHSLLFAGMDGIGKGLFALELAKLLIAPEGSDAAEFYHKRIAQGFHPDVRVYRPEGKLGMYSIASMRQFSEEVYLYPYEAAKKIFILHDVERMLPTSANALLKTFEEPPATSVIILISSAPERLLPTILSRCHTFYFQALSEEEVARIVQEKKGLPAEEASALAALARGSAARALQHAQEGGAVRKLLLDFLAEGEVLSYAYLSECVQTITKALEQEKEAQHEALSHELTEGWGDNLNMVQRQAIEKEVEGAVALQQGQEAKMLFETVLSWYRDLHLLRVGGSPALLLNRDYEEHLHKQQGTDLQPIEAIQEAVADAMLAVERSTAVSIALEGLFLKTQWA